MIEKTHEIKEVVISEKQSVKYYHLYAYNPNHYDVDYQWCLILLSTDIGRIQDSKKKWTLSEGESFRVFEINLPKASTLTPP